MAPKRPGERHAGDMIQGHGGGGKESQVRLDRRQFGAAALASFAFPGLVALARAQAPADDYLNQAEGYGPLQPDPAGLFDLPVGFGYRIVSQAGEAMDDGYAAPGHFDGMACFRLDRRRIALVRNHELNQDHQAIGPTGGLARLQQRLAGEPCYGRDNGGRVLPGGTSTIVYNLATGRRESQYLSLAGTMVNCAGGPTPW